MKKKIIKYLFLITSFLVLLIFYLSIVGLETEKFNNQIKNKVKQSNNKIDIDLKKIKLTLDPFKLKINAKTIGTKIIYQKKDLELEYIKVQIPLTSLLKNKFASSSLKLSTRSILLKNLITFVRATNNKPELFILEQAIKKGHVIINVELNFDEKGVIKKDYEFSMILKDGKMKLLKNYNFNKANFFLKIKNNIFNFSDISFSINKINFFSDNLKITQEKRNLLLEGEIENKNSLVNNELLRLGNLNFKNLNLFNINFSSKNKFSFNIDNRYKIKNLVIDSEIQVNNAEYQRPPIFNNYFPEMNDIIHIKDHKIKASFKKNDLVFEGFGKIKFEKEFDEIQYKYTKDEKDFNLVTNLDLKEIKFKKQKFLLPFFPKLNELIDLKKQKITINYNKNNLFLNGEGKIKLENDFDEIDFYISKKGDNFEFGTQIDLNSTSLNIDFLNFKKNNKLKTQLKIIGNYKKNIQVNFEEINILEKNNKILLKNISLDKKNRIIKVDKIETDYFDIDNKKNQLLILRKHNNDYVINGSVFNAKRLITDLLKNNSNDDTKLFKNDMNFTLDLNEVYIDDKDIINNLKGIFRIKRSKVVEADISALFDKNENLIFTLNTNNKGEKITTLFSSRAKPLVKRYKFIKGFENGYLDFSSSKIDGKSKSKLNIYDFKLQELPALTKLLTLASLQGIADLLSGDGIGFKEFEMNFSNEGESMIIEEIYAIGPAISILMNGYIEEDKVISLRGTLVPATTINKTIGSIPLLGKILVGNKAGEGVFGVSFKIKGPSKNLVTSVNPIKTLTPRFITRTLERIKKN
jgi:hypothetical protein